jgi:general secretion pathway protein H
MRVTSATGSRGFTLLELMVVMAIVGLMAAAVPLVFSRQSLQSRRTAAGAQLLQAALRDAQSRSILYNEPAQVSVSDRTLVVVFASTRPGAAKAPRQSYSIDAPLSVARDMAGTVGPVILYPDGSASGAILRVGDGAQQASVSISAISGRISIVGSR